MSAIQARKFLSNFQVYREVNVINMIKPNRLGHDV